VALELERQGGGSFATRIAHYACEMALQADSSGQPQQAEQALQRAREAAPAAVRPQLLTGQRQATAGAHAQALQLWDAMLAQHPAAWPLVAADYARSAMACADCSGARERLAAAYAAEPDTDLLRARLELEADPAQRQRLVLEHLQLQPTLGAAAMVLELPLEQWGAQTPPQLQKVVAASARPLQRYRCAACGFEAHHYFWQCPGCQGWDTYPPKRMESL
jgi:lipopolysaccharide biosynthesis regulator YciM